MTEMFFYDGRTGEGDFSAVHRSGTFRSQVRESQRCTPVERDENEGPRNGQVPSQIPFIPHPFDKFENLPLCAARGECALPLCGMQGYINGVSRLPNHPAMRLRMGIFFQRSGVSR